MEATKKPNKGAGKANKRRNKKKVLDCGNRIRGFEKLKGML